MGDQQGKVVNSYKDTLNLVPELLTAAQSPGIHPA